MHACAFVYVYKLSKLPYLLSDTKVKKKLFAFKDSLNSCKRGIFYAKNATEVILSFFYNYKIY